MGCDDDDGWIMSFYERNQYTNCGWSPGATSKFGIERPNTFRNPMVSRTTYVVLVTQDQNPHRASPPQEPACGCATSRNFTPRSRYSCVSHQLLMWKGNKSNCYYKQLRDGANKEIFCDGQRATKFSRLSEPSVHGETNRRNNGPRSLISYCWMIP